MDKKNSIKVIFRARKLSKEESERNEKLIVMNDNSINMSGQTYNFDKCFWSVDNSQPFADQATIFSTFRDEMIECMNKSYNFCLFAYGRTGSGKSYTMLGNNDKENYGILPRTFDLILEFAKDRKDVKLRMKMYEIYNEEVSDLLSPSNKKLSIVLKDKNSFEVKDLKEEEGMNFDQMMHIYLKGIKNRQTANTLLNAKSSRSHLNFVINISIGYKTSIFQLLDLAGSENTKKSGVENLKFSEAVYINLSLTNLGMVISDISKNGTSTHFRESALTKILKNALGGNSRTAAIMTVGPTESEFKDTKSTILFAQSLKKIVNDPKTNLVLSEDLGKIKFLLKEVQNEKEKQSDIIIQLKERVEELEKAQEKNLQEKKNVSLTKSKIKTKCPFLELIKKKNEDNVILNYKIKGDKITITSMEEKIPSSGFLKIPFSGINPDHCEISIDEISKEYFIEKKNDNIVYLNGKKFEKKEKLKHLDRIILGETNFFLFKIKESKNENYDFQFFLKEKYEKPLSNFKSKNEVVDLKENDFLKLILKKDWANENAKRLGEMLDFKICFKKETKEIYIKEEIDKKKFETKQFLKMIRKYKFGLRIKEEDEIYFSKTLPIIEQHASKLEKIQQKYKKENKYLEDIEEEFKKKKNFLENYGEDKEKLGRVMDFLDKIEKIRNINNFEQKQEFQNVSENNWKEGLNLCKETMEIVKKMVGLFSMQEQKSSEEIATICKEIESNNIEIIEKINNLF